MDISLGFVLKTLGALASALFAVYGTLNEPREPNPEKKGETRPSKAARVGVVGAILGALLTVGVASSESAESKRQEDAVLGKINDAKVEVQKAEGRVRSVDEKVKTEAATLYKVETGVQGAAKRVGDLAAESLANLDSVKQVIKSQRQILRAQKAQNRLASNINTKQSVLVSDGQTVNLALSEMLHPFKPIRAKISMWYRASDQAIKPTIDRLIDGCKAALASEGRKSSANGDVTPSNLFLDEYNVRLTIGTHVFLCIVEAPKRQIESITLFLKDIDPGQAGDKKLSDPTVSGLYYFFTSYYFLAVGDDKSLNYRKLGDELPAEYPFSVDDAQLRIYPRQDIVNSLADCKNVGLALSHNSSSVGLPELAGRYAELRVQGRGPTPIQPAKNQFIPPYEQPIDIICESTVHTLDSDPTFGGVGLRLTWKDFVSVDRKSVPPTTVPDSPLRISMYCVRFKIVNSDLHY